MKIRFLGMLAIAFAVASCDDNTGTIGIIDGADNVEVSQGTFNVATQSIKADSVLARTSTCYLGRVTDPETNSTIESSFMAQFFTQEGTSFPAYSQLMKDAGGDILIDSVDLRLYFSSFYGDSLNSMKMSVYELDTANVLQEGQTYYSNIDPQPYVNPLNSNPIAYKVFSVSDLTNDQRNTSDYNVRVPLSTAYGKFVVKKYFENPSFFANSYNFIRHVVPGFYFQMNEGNGTMIYVDETVLSVYYRYTDGDSIYNATARFAATGEVIQNTKIANSSIDNLVADGSCSYVKSPAGIFTEATLPIDNIYTGHETDSVNSARLVFTRYNNTSAYNAYNLGIPQTLLLLRKQDLYSFFEKNEVYDEVTSFVASFTAGYNTYTFTNIANLVAYCKNERKNGAAAQGISTAAWEAQNPDWNKVVVVPVSLTTSSSTVTNVSHDMSLSSARLVGGSDKLTIQVLYSKFRR